METKPMKKKWVIMFALMALVAIGGIFCPEHVSLWESDAAVDTADVAWMITATIFVLMMTPGLSFFYGGMVGKKNV
ncbi:MAG: ammonia channel protein, partial [Alloprevotella sp.]